MRRDEINEQISTFFRKSRFDKKAIGLFEKLSEIIFEARKNECTEKNKLIAKNIQELEIKKKHISENVTNLLNYPDLLENQNEELQKIKSEIMRLHTLKVDTLEGIGLDRFKKCSKKILEHPESLLQRDKPEMIQLAFEVFFD